MRRSKKATLYLVVLSLLSVSCASPLLLEATPIASSESTLMLAHERLELGPGKFLRARSTRLISSPKWVLGAGQVCSPCYDSNS